MSVSIQSTVNINNNCLPRKESQPAATEGNAKAEKSAEIHERHAASQILAWAEKNWMRK